MGEEIDYSSYNKTELSTLVRSKTGVVVKRSVDSARLIELLKSGGSPLPEETSPTTESRKKLQLYIEKHWDNMNSQLPCKGENKGKCTIYPCSEGRHVDCYSAAEPHMKIHAIL